MIGFDWITGGGNMSFEMWLILQLMEVVKTALMAGLAGLALVPAVRLMRAKGKK